MKPKIYVVVLILLIVSHHSVGAGLYDLRSGRVWVYAIEGAEQNATSSIERSIKINDVDWYELVEYGERFWIRNTPQGQVEAANFFEREINLSEPIEEIMVFKYPASVGDEWGDMGAKSSYLGLRNVRVPAGAFDCHLYRFELGEGAYSESCVAEGIGVVFNEFKNSAGKLDVSKLVRYE